MFSKICLFLFICLLGLQSGCQTSQVSATSSDNVAQQTNWDNVGQQTTDNDQMDEKIKWLFVESGLGEGDGSLQKLMTFPRERIIAVVQKIKENGLSENDEQYFNERNNEILKMKAASFLWTLGVEREANEKYIVDIASKKDSRRFFAIEHVGVFISEGKKEYFPVVFEDALNWDGAFLYIQSFLLDELENSPKPFLLYLSKEPDAIRKRIYWVITLDGEFFDEKRFGKIKANIAKLKSDAEIKGAAEEFLREVNKKR